MIFGIENHIIGYFLLGFIVSYALVAGLILFRPRWQARFKGLTDSQPVWAYTQWGAKRQARKLQRKYGWGNFKLRKASYD